jgi:hypothetical protein
MFIGYFDTAGNIVQESTLGAFIVKEGMIILRTENLITPKVKL